MLQRNNFVEGKTVIQQQPVKPYQPRERTGESLFRNNFLAPNPTTRASNITLGFDSLPGVQTVQLADETMEKLFKIQIDDPEDHEWIKERDRIMKDNTIPAEQKKTMLPLGRKQRKISKMTNLGQSLKRHDKIEQLLGAVNQNIAKSSTGQGAIMAQLALLVEHKTLTHDEMMAVQSMVDKVHVPRDYRALFNGKRFFNRAEYMANAGLINLFIISQSSSTNIQIAVYNDATDKETLRPLSKLQHALVTRNGLDKLFDLKTGTVFNADFVKSMFPQHFETKRFDDEAF